MGFPEKTADIRMAQYEAGSRTPKTDLTKALANALEVSPLALDIPDIDSYLGLMHTLFALEDRYGLPIENRKGEVVFRFDPRKEKDAATISKMVYAWSAAAKKYRKGEIGKDDYDKWRYSYPMYDTSQHWVKAPSQELSNALFEAFKDKLKD